MTPEEIGKAYKAYLAFNFKAKKDRLKDFDLNRWIKVVDSIENTKSLARFTKRVTKAAKRSWTPEQRKRFQATIAANRTYLAKNGHAKNA